jgi:hypothetical protein
MSARGAAASLRLWDIVVLLQAVIASASGLAAAPVKSLHNLPGHAQVYLAAGACVAWRIDDWRHADLRAEATVGEGSPCQQNTLKCAC